MGKNILLVALAPALLLTGGCKAQNQDHDPIIHTTRVLLDELAPEEAAAIKQNFGW